MRAKLMALVAATLGTTAAQAQTTVYINDFESNTNGFSTSGRTSLPRTADSSSPLSSMLGRFAGNQGTTLSLSGLDPGEVYDLDFDLFIGGSWDGNNSTYGPDCFILTSNGQELINTTFSRVINGPAFYQAYSDGNLLGNLGGPNNFAPGEGADVVSNDSGLFSGYNIYYFGGGRPGAPGVSFTADASGMASLTFQGLGLQEVRDEYWALDNVRVRNRVIPEPGAAALALLGLPALALLRRRK